MAKISDDVFVEEVRTLKKTAFGTAFLILRNTADCEDAFMGLAGIVDTIFA